MELQEITSLVRGYPSGYYKITCWFIDIFGVSSVSDMRFDTKEGVLDYVNRKMNEGVEVTDQVKSCLNIV